MHILGAFCQILAKKEGKADDKGDAPRIMSGRYDLVDFVQTIKPMDWL